MPRGFPPESVSITARVPGNFSGAHEISRGAWASGLRGRVSARGIVVVRLLLVDEVSEAAMFKRILVPLDFSTPSDAALDYARIVAARFGASLHLLHVAEDPYRALYSAEVFVPEMEGLRDEILGDATGRLKDRLRDSEMTELHATAEAIIGTPASSIVEYAGGREIDLIVMGTHGRGGMSHLLMGSVAERVVRMAPCPVLTVRQRPAKAVKAA
jgi:nucleotide-binding universal stress UspA family protein